MSAIWQALYCQCLFNAKIQSQIHDAPTLKTQIRDELSLAKAKISLRTSDFTNNMNINVWHGSVDRYVAPLVYSPLKSTLKYRNILMDCHEIL